MQTTPDHLRKGPRVRPYVSFDVLVSVRVTKWCCAHLYPLLFCREHLTAKFIFAEFLRNADQNPVENELRGNVK